MMVVALDDFVFKGFEKGICFKCKNFDIETWIANEDKSEVIRGALACRANGVAGENKIACNCFEEADNQ